MKINNLPEYASKYNFIVVNRVDGAFWFWGAYNDRNRANETALEIGGVVFHKEDIEG